MTQSRQAALIALQNLLNIPTVERETASFAAWQIAHPGATPPNDEGIQTVLPNCELDTAFDWPGIPGEILRGLGVLSGGAQPQTQFSGDGVEAGHKFIIEWMVIVPTEKDELRLPIYNAGIAEIEQVLCNNPGLPNPDLAPPDDTAATVIAFEISDFTTVHQNYGDVLANAAYITLNVILDAQTILS